MPVVKLDGVVQVPVKPLDFISTTMKNVMVPTDNLLSARTAM